MKICHVTSVHTTTDTRIFIKECKSLTKDRANKVYLVGPGESRIDNSVIVVGVEEKPAGRIERMTTFTSKVIHKAQALKADVYHLHDPELLRHALKLKRQGAKVIFDSHENVLISIDEKTYIPLLIRKIIKAYYSILEKKVLPKLDGIIIVTPSQVSAYEKYNQNIVMVSNFPIWDDCWERDKSQSIECNIASNAANKASVVGVFAGGISKSWSHNEIIEALGYVDNVEYRLFGFGTDQYIGNLKTLPNWNKVYYGGQTTYEEVQREIDAADFAFVVLKPGLNTNGMVGTLGNTKLFEAMLHGKPVIATDFDLWKPIVEEGGCGICIPPNDVNAIVEAIMKITANLEIAQKMGIRGQQMIKEKYNWNIEEKKLFELYEKLKTEKVSIRGTKN